MSYTPQSREHKLRVTKKLYIVFKYSKLLNKYKMCSHDLHNGQYNHCPFLILLTCPHYPRNTLKCHQTIHICFCVVFFCLFLNSIGNLDSCLVDRHRPHRQYTWNSIQCRMETSKEERGHIEPDSEM